MSGLSPGRYWEYLSILKGILCLINNILLAGRTQSVRGPCFSNPDRTKHHLQTRIQARTRPQTNHCIGSCIGIVLCLLAWHGGSTIMYWDGFRFVLVWVCIVMGLHWYGIVSVLVWAPFRVIITAIPVLDLCVSKM